VKGKPKKGAPKGSKNAAKNKPAETADLNLDNTTTEDIAKDRKSEKVKNQTAETADRKTEDIAKDLKVSPKKVQQMNVIDDKATEGACEV